MKNFIYANDCIVKKTRNLERCYRDDIFIDVLSKFKELPVKIFQVGAIETLDFRWHSGSGWSDIIFGSYVKKHGGKIKICDIDLNHIANSSFVAKNLDYEIVTELADAAEIIGQEEYDIYYLDGGNDPKETENQFNSITSKNCVVLIDDLFIKGTTLREKIKFDLVYDIGNGFGIKYINNKKS